MINRTAEDYRKVLDPRRARRAFLYRAGLGTVLIVVMVVGLTLYDEGHDAVDPPVPPIPEPSAESLSPVAGMPAAPPASEDARGGGDEEGDALADASEANTEADLSAQEAPGDADADSDVAEAPDEGAPEVSQVPPAVTVAVVPEAKESPRQSAGMVQPAAAPASNRNYQVQLGGFMDAEPFAALDAALSGMDDPVVTQFRVAVGPFPERGTADDVLGRLRRERAVRGIVVSEPANGSYAVQAGVFAESANADALARKLAGWGYPVKLQKRVVAGPFPDRQAAETLQARLRDERGIESVIVDMPAK